MGGSALPGDLIHTALSQALTIPILVHKSYDLPTYVDSHTLLFVISYSGNTEETLAIYKAAKAKNCKLIVVTSGGKLRDLAEKDSKPLILIPATGIQPRHALGYMFFSILRVIQNSGMIKDQSEDVKKIINHLRNHEFKMYGEELSTKLIDKTPIIYASEPMWAVAEIWKIAFNENSKTLAFWNYIPELNHNEMVGYTNPKGDYYVIFIKEDDCSRDIAKRFKVTKDLIAKKALTTELLIKGSSKLMRIFSAIFMGYWTTYFLALKYGIDPTPVEMVEEFKKKI
jgi:glucose/mannose-6-phosphate isomerase